MTADGRLLDAPALLCGLAGDSESATDLGPRIAGRSQAVDSLLDGVVDLVRQADQIG